MSTFYETIKALYLNRYMSLSSKKKAAEQLDLRDLLQNKILHAKDSGGVPILGFRSSDYLKASFHEVLRFSSRGIIAYSDFCVDPQLTSRSWRYVTLYYSLYFFVTSFGRMAGRSILYLDSDDARNLSVLVSGLARSTFNLKSGDYLISLDRPNDPLVSRDFVDVTISRLNGGSHQNAWNQFNLLLNSWRNEFSGKGWATVNGMIGCLRPSPCIFSEARNRINYRGIAALHEIDKSILHLGSDKSRMSVDELDREVMSIIGPLSGDNDVLQVAHSLGSFFCSFHQTALRDLSDGQPHPGTYYIKHLLRP